ncbi:AUGMIN subunit 2-like isoform X2 [Zingiber officinale]|uniref:AUGMIN subunit 2-like isoform X2 n=2 Tax=Zingiber officinale TaxID=94328 RepID=UPI001C4B96F2|nr:AUGMIN subunit 2-like isoform X2 [Zingiber officinale]
MRSYEFKREKTKKAGEAGIIRHLKSRRPPFALSSSASLRISTLIAGLALGGAEMSVSSDPGCAGKKPPKRLGGMAEALSIASDLGFRIPAVQEDQQNLSNSICGDKGDDLIRVLRQLTTVQRNIANLQVELQGRKDDKNVAHLTHVSEMEKKCESLARITAILKDVIQNKDRIISRLQQPYSLDCIPVEAEYQKQFSELLLKAASDYGALTAAVADFQWCQNFKEPPTIWGEMLRPIPAALASCTRFFEAMSAMRDSFATLQRFRWREGTTRSDDSLVDDSWRQQQDLTLEASDEISHRRLSWPSPVKKGL